MHNPYLDFVTSHGLNQHNPAAPSLDRLRADPLYDELGLGGDAGDAAVAAGFVIAGDMAERFPFRPDGSGVPAWARLDHPGRLSASFAVRQRAVKYWAWAIPTGDLIRRIAALGPVLEQCAGTGYWAWLLRQAGADVAAYDSHPGQNDVGQATPPVPRKIWSPVAEGSFEVCAGGRYDDRTLLLVWPPYDDPVAHDCVRAWKGKNLVYVGEWGDCTADEGFHKYLEENFDGPDVADIPVWPGLHDRAYFLTRKA